MPDPSFEALEGCDWGGIVAAAERVSRKPVRFNPRSSKQHIRAALDELERIKDPETEDQVWLAVRELEIALDGERF